MKDIPEILGIKLYICTVLLLLIVSPIGGINAISILDLEKNIKLLSLVT